MKTEETIHPFLRPFQEFFKSSAAGGILLFISAVAAMIWVHSPFSQSYFALWQAPIAFGQGEYAFSKPLILWINDGLMAVFFFVIGLEIKREILCGELATVKKATLPVAGAIGGIVLPALIYISLNYEGEAVAGWGIPMATDIAFSLGLVALLRSRVTLSLKIFLTALAIVDDLCAVLVIAFFYTQSIYFSWLGVAAVMFALLMAFNLLGVRRVTPYMIFGLVLWFAFLNSGVHATIAGVLLAFTIPFKPKIKAEELGNTLGIVLDEIKGLAGREGEPEFKEEMQNALHDLEVSAEQAGTPLQRLEHALHPWVNFFVMPVFALANAGVVLSWEGFKETIASPISLGVIFGLFIGKQVGIFLLAFAAVKVGLAKLPEGVGWIHLYGIGAIAGIGFTMSLFIAGLAFFDPELLDMAKVGIFTGSILSGICGATILMLSPKIKES